MILTRFNELLNLATNQYINFCFYFITFKIDFLENFFKIIFITNYLIFKQL